MRIGLLADTHVPDRQAELPSRLFSLLEGVDHILHAGDVTRSAVLDALAQIAPVTAVRGDWDAADVDAPPRRVLTLGGRRIGLIHGRRSRAVEVPSLLVGMLTRRMWTPGLDRWLLQQFEGDQVEVIVYGHLHRPRRARVGEVLLINPGGVWTGPLERWIRPPASPSLAILETESLHVTFWDLMSND